MTRNDLPVAWDGVPLEWDSWEPEPWSSAMFHCKPIPCERCGSTAPCLTNAAVTVETRPDGPPRRVLRLFAYRCSNCWLDHVQDVQTGEGWVLDDTDYGNAGSWVTQEALF